MTADRDRAPDGWYPSSICAWEMKHGIVRQEVGGILYVSAPDFMVTCDSIRREKAVMAQAEAAAKHYGGESTSEK